MKNPFSKDAQGKMHLKRNAFPHSYQNLFTTEFGRITPTFCKEVIPGDTVHIKKGTSIAIQAMPTVFPLQTRVRVSLSFYYSQLS